MEETPGPPPRLGAVDLADVALIAEPNLQDSPEFQGITSRLEQSQQIVEAIQARGEFPLGELLNTALDSIVAGSGLDGMMIASADGLVVAQSSTVDTGEILAAIGCLFESIVTRAQSEGLIAAVEEMTLRGFSGEQLIARYLVQQEQRFVLIAYSRGQCAHRRATTRALKQCGALLAIASGPPNPKARRKQSAGGQPVGG